MTEYLFGPVWYSTVPNLQVDWDIVTATYVATTNQMMQRCQRPMLNPSAHDYYPTNFNRNVHGPENVTKMKTNEEQNTSETDVDSVKIVHIMGKEKVITKLNNKEQQKNDAVGEKLHSDKNDKMMNQNDVHYISTRKNGKEINAKAMKELKTNVTETANYYESLVQTEDDDDDIEEVFNEEVYDIGRKIVGQGKVDELNLKNDNTAAPVLEPWLKNYKLNVLDNVIEVMNEIRCDMNLSDPVKKDKLSKIYQTMCETQEYAATATEHATLATVTDKVQQLYEEFNKIRAATANEIGHVDDSPADDDDDDGKENGKFKENDDLPDDKGNMEPSLVQTENSNDQDAVMNVEVVRKNDNAKTLHNETKPGATDFDQNSPEYCDCQEHMLDSLKMIQ